MTKTISENCQLSVDSTMAARLLRKNPDDLPIFAWLHRPASHGNSIAPSLVSRLDVDGSDVSRILDELLQPLINEMESSQKEAMRSSPLWLPALFTELLARDAVVQLECTHRLLATALLPLYRSLGTGEVRKNFAETRARLAELLVLGLLGKELGSDLGELLHLQVTAGGNPYDTLKESCGINLVVVAKLVRRLSVDYGGPDHADRMQNVLSMPYSEQSYVPEWAEPRLLWRLAGELLSRKPEFVLPRQWMEIEVPWTKSAEHFGRLVQALKIVQGGKPTAVTQTTSASLEPDDCTMSLNSPGMDACDGEILDWLCDATTAEQQGESSQTNAQKECLSNDLSESNTAKSRESEADVESEENSTFGDTQNEELHDSAHQNSHETERTNDGPDVPAAIGSSSKVVISEIASHNDPGFCNVIRRQVRNCRNTKNPMSLIAIEVKPDSEHEKFTSQPGGGLTYWQQKLVNHVASQPGIQEPMAFTTSVGELVICLMGAERNEATSIVRECMFGVFSTDSGNKSNSALTTSSLSAKIHCGIGSLHFPIPKVEAEALIEATWRCLAAAGRHGSMSIKSIEVF
ncbi:MAG: hypothetical protein KDB03_11875 [Planctomycetales bacterium]|nr:hypothetical protein [Planctomycetales bacterium]